MNLRRLRNGYAPGKTAVNLRLRILAENDGHVIISVISYYSKAIDYEQLGGEGDRTPVRRHSSEGVADVLLRKAGEISNHCHFTVCAGLRPRFYTRLVFLRP